MLPEKKDVTDVDTLRAKKRAEGRRAVGQWGRHKSERTQEAERRVLLRK